MSEPVEEYKVDSKRCTTCHLPRGPFQVVADPEPEVVVKPTAYGFFIAHCRDCGMEWTLGEVYPFGPGDQPMRPAARRFMELTKDQAEEIESGRTSPAAMPEPALRTLGEQLAEAQTAEEVMRRSRGFVEGLRIRFAEPQGASGLTFGAVLLEYLELAAQRGEDVSAWSTVIQWAARQKLLSKPWGV